MNAPVKVKQGGEPAKTVTAEIHGVRRDLASARDEQLTRVVALVDAMPDRGAADALVAPFRERLAVLRPVRPFNFTRLLFTPLDALIVAPAAWRRGAQTVPRQTLPALAAMVRGGMGPGAQTLETALAQKNAVAASTAGLGKMIWPDAARILAAAPAPERWRAETGLTNEDFASVARLVSTLLAMALDRQIIAEQIANDGIANHTQFAGIVAAALHAPAEIAVVATGMLLGGMTRPDLVLQALDAQSGAPGTSGAVVTERAIDFALEQTLGIAAPALDRLSRLRGGAALLRALDGRPPPAATRRALMQRARDAVEQGCRVTFGKIIDSQFHGVIATLRGAATDDQVASLEQTARELRELETIGRQLGKPAAYRDKLAAILTDVQNSDNLSWADRVRLTELLSNSDAAMAMYRKATQVEK